MHTYAFIYTIYIYTCTWSIQKHIYKHIHGYRDIYTYMYMHLCIHMNIYRCTPTYAHTCTHMNTQNAIFSPIIPALGS